MATDWRHMPSLTALRAFAATAELRGFSNAARALNVTTAAVGQQVRALEDQLGVALVRRDGRGMSLTEDGATLAAALGQGFAAFARGVEALKTGGADRPIKITLTASFAAQWLMPRLRDFWGKYPEIGLSLHPDPRVIDLHRDGFDVGIRYGQGQWAGTESRFLASARLVVVGAPVVLGDRTRLEKADLARANWILAANWPEQDDYLRGLGLDPKMLQRSSFPNEELSIAAAREGLGLIVESIALVEADVAEGRLRMVQDSDEIRPAYFIVTPPGPQRSAVRTFVKWLSAQT
jgi:LysR family transcriptional regulator, glycine cleavage system transcriptional activator